MHVIRVLNLNIIGSRASVLEGYVSWKNKCRKSKCPRRACILDGQVFRNGR